MYVDASEVTNGLTDSHTPTERLGDEGRDPRERQADGPCGRVFWEDLHAMLNVLQKHLQCKTTGPPGNSVCLSSPYLVHWTLLLSDLLVLIAHLVHTIHSHH